MPVPQRFNFIVEWDSSPPQQARCLFHKDLILLWAVAPSRPPTGKMPVPHIIAQNLTISISQ